MLTREEKIKVLDKLQKCLVAIESMCKAGVDRASLYIDGLTYEELIYLYHEKNKHSEVNIYMPGELFNDTLQIRWVVAEGYYIYLNAASSEKVKINLNYN